MTVRIFDEDALSVIAVNRGQRFFIRRGLPKYVEDMAEVMKTEDGNAMLTMKEDCILVVDRMHENGMTAEYLRYIRENRRSRGLQFATPRIFPKLRAALKHANRQNEHASGGFDYAVIYSDELAVIDGKEYGAYGYVVGLKEIGKLLEALPPRAEKVAA